MQAAESLQASARALADEFAALAAAASRLEAAWNGEAKEAFHQRHVTFQHEAAAAAGELSRAASSLRALAEEYAAADRKAAAAQPSPH